jgi:hypothetical protein
MYTEDASRGPELSPTEPETAQDLSPNPSALEQKIEACKALYLAYQGRHHEAIEREMRRLGYKNFTRRILYTRNQRGQSTPGWPERYKWNEELRGRVSVPPAGAGGLTAKSKLLQHKRGLDSSSRILVIFNHPLPQVVLTLVVSRLHRLPTLSNLPIHSASLAVL